MATTASRAAVAAACIRSSSSAAGAGSVSTSQAAVAAARLARSESGAVETPSHTTSTARPPARGSPVSAIASSLRWCRRPLSVTAPSHGAISWLQWSRGFGALAPQRSQ